MDFKAITTEWIALKAQLAAARKDLSVLNQREKELRKFVTEHMAFHEIDTVKVHEKIKVNFKKSRMKGALTKDVIKTDLARVFWGEEVPVAGPPPAFSKPTPLLGGKG